MLVKFCKNKKVEKMLAILLIITMTFANIAFLGKNLISYASNENLEKQGLDTQHSNVKFDAYFSENGGNNVHAVVFDATSNTQKMNLYLSVKKTGYLKEAYIDFRDETNGQDTNYELSADTSDTTLIQSVSTDTKTIALNYINNGTEAVIEMPIKFEFTELTNIDKIRQNSLVTLRGIYVDENGKETAISKTIKLNIGWSLETELNLEQSVTKYVTYSNNGDSKTLVQLSVKAKQNRDDLALPVKSTQIKIKVPEILEALPEKVEVTAGSLMATNGNKVEFTSDNWEYNEEEKTITINTPGYNDNGLVWSGVGLDEYFITYIYSGIADSEMSLPCEAQGEMVLYTTDGITSKTAESIGVAPLSEKIGDIVTYNIEANSKEISKGKMYANCNSEENPYDTEYSYTLKANISNPEIVNKIDISLFADSFANEENIYTTTLNNVNYTQYNQISIDKLEMQKILGEDGIIEIYNNNSKIYEINNQTEDTNGKYILNFENVTGTLSIRTSKPVEYGILQINVTKAISKDITYEKTQLMQVNSLKVNAVGYTYSEVENAQVLLQDTIALTETLTCAQLEISNTELTSMVENKNVEMKIVFNNNVETSDLYKNPVFTINLPKYIEDIEITGGNILYTNGLSIDYVERNYTENGIVLKVYTTGAETSFSNGVFTNGTNIVLNTNIKVNTLAPNIADEIVMTYTNENATSYANDAKDEVTVNFVAPEEMVAFNSVLTSGIETTSLDGNEQTAKLEILDSSKTATMKISILNKYSNVCNNIRILGRTPFVGNKSITTGLDLGTTFDAKLISAINTNGVEATVYYSSVENATEDLSDANNGWTLDWTTLSDVKSYLIILTNYEMQPGEMLEFTYNCQIPEGLEHNESAYGLYAIYFDSVSEYIAPNATEATKVGLTTGIGANMEMTTTSLYNGKKLQNGDTVNAYQTITYQTVISNTGTVDAENVVLNSTIQNGVLSNLDNSNATVNGNTLTWNIGDINAGESKTVEYSIIVNEANSTNSKIINNITATADNFSSALTSEQENTINEKTAIKMKINTQYPVGQEFTNGKEITFIISAENITNETINNAVLETYLPEGLDYVSTSTREKDNEIISYNGQTKILTYNVDKIDANSKIFLEIKVRTNIPYTVGRIDTKTYATLVAEGIDTYGTDIYKISLVGPILTAETSTTLQNNVYMKEGDEVTFTIKVKNTGTIVAKNISIEQILPPEFVVTQAVYTKGSETYEMMQKGTNTYRAGFEIPVGAEITAIITAKAELIGKVEEKTVETTSQVLYGEDTIVKTETYAYTIEEKTVVEDPNGEGQGGTGTNKPTIETYKIKGMAWVDANNNGQMDEDEEPLEGVSVMLVNADTGVIVQDIVNGTLKKTTTEVNGSYTFKNIPKGKYIVIFEYDTNYYDITEYNKKGVSEDRISKVLSRKANIDGVTKLVGITDTLEISNSSISNINIGLVERPKFDLSLQKTISKITVENKSGLKEYNLENTNLTKVEIPGKYILGSKLTIEYKITVKNEGAVAGYVRKIVDYIPNDTELASTNWYKGNDKYLYNEELSNTLINPGETKEITLTLTKTLKTEDAEIINNTAEIYETYTLENYEDIDSTPGNSAQGEDDLGSADIIVTVKTGQIVFYVTITIICILILAGGIVLINKKVLKGGKM